MRISRPLAVLALAALSATIAVPAAAGPRQTVDYVALGDSYSAGTGARGYTDQRCQRSEFAYPVLTADDIGADLTFVACGGATTEDLLDEQAGALDEDTDLVTVTIGGNDIGWSQAITACMIPIYDCTRDIERAERKAEEELPAKLDAVYTAIGNRSPEAEVYVLGYPRLFAAENRCDAFGLISVEEQERMNQGADLLSEVIEAAARAHDLHYVDVRDDFDGHAICDEDEWIHGLTYPIGESYHPNRSGHSEGYGPALADALSQSANRIPGVIT